MELGDVGLGTRDLRLEDVGRGTWDVGRGTWDVGRGTWDVGRRTRDLRLGDLGLEAMELEDVGLEEVELGDVGLGVSRTRGDSWT